MSDSTISAMENATLPLTTEAVPCVQFGINKQAPAAAFGIPIVSTGAPTPVSAFQTWIDNSANPARLSMWLDGEWIELYKIGNDGTLTLSHALTAAADPVSS